jgi:hypothetical protein
MVQQVSIVSILMIVHGALVTVTGLLFAFMGPAMFALIHLDPNPDDPDEKVGAAMMLVVSLSCGGLWVIVGALNVFAGIQCRNFRGHTLSLVALFSNLLAVFSLICSPTSLGLIIYGLMVLMSADVKRAFSMAAQGATTLEILNAFEPGRRRNRDDRDEPWRSQEYDRRSDDENRFRPG